MHILLIDDDPVHSEMLTEYLAGEGILTTAVFTGQDGVAAALSNKFDLIVLDIMLPGMNGNEVLRRIRQTSSISVVMLTAKGGDLDRVIGLEMGADDYIAKPFFPREMVARLRAVMRRQREHAPSAADAILQLGPLELSSGKRQARWNRVIFELTNSEFDLLENLLRAGDLVATKEDLSPKVLGRRWETYDRSIDVHVSNLRKKLAACSSNKVEIETVRGIGYRLRLLP